MIQDPFRSMIRSEGVLRYRDLPWRRTRDPYIIWLSEVMLQQTQVPRVEARMPVWLDRFPTVQALAQAAPSDVLDAWQGMGYNRRALALHGAAQRVVEDWGGEFPRARRTIWSRCPVLARQRRRASVRLRLIFQACIWRPMCARSFCIISFPMCRPFPIAS